MLHARIAIDSTNQRNSKTMFFPKNGVITSFKFQTSDKTRQFSEIFNFSLESPHIS